jgi:hypothetical protein
VHAGRERRAGAGHAAAVHRVRIGVGRAGPPEGHPAPGYGRLLAAGLTGVAKRLAPWRGPSQGESDAAVPQLREIAGDCPDQLAEWQISCSAPSGRLRPRRRRSKAAASFCIAGDADETFSRGCTGERRCRAPVKREPLLPATRRDARRGAPGGDREPSAPCSSQAVMVASPVPTGIANALSTFNTRA